ncbi:MAG TPA: hypothetical protein EYP55_04555 [Anaerolineae bacterium]|nr:hypothetical protein [Anaerolineae bacterium]
MRCREASELMSLHLDHRLASDQVAELQDHLIACPRCQREWEAMQRVSFLLMGAPLIAPPADFTAKVMGRLAQREARRRLFWGGVVLLLGALSLGALALPSLVEPLLLLWPLVAHPSLVGKGLLALGQLLYALRSFLEVCRLVVTALLSAINPSFLLFYPLIALLLTVFWLTIVLPQIRQGLPGSLREG